MPAQPNIVPSAFKLAYSVAGARQVHELTLPIVLSSFNTPTGMDTPTFMKRWGSLQNPAQECRVAFSVPGVIDASRVSTLVSSNVHLAVIDVRTPLLALVRHHSCRR